MAWESRNGRGRYYTRSKRLNGRVVREYVGCGQVGEEAAEGDLERRQKLQAEQREIKALRDQDQEMDELVASFGLVSDQLAKAALLLAGFRQHKLGEWRRCRERVDRLQKRHFAAAKMVGTFRKLEAPNLQVHIEQSQFNVG